MILVQLLEQGRRGRKPRASGDDPPTISAGTLSMA